MDGKVYTSWIEYLAYNIDLDEMITSGVMLLDEMLTSGVTLLDEMPTSCVTLWGKWLEK